MGKSQRALEKSLACNNLKSLGLMRSQVPQSGPHASCQNYSSTCSRHYLPRLLMYLTCRAKFRIKIELKPIAKNHKNKSTRLIKTDIKRGTTRKTELKTFR